MIEVMAIVLIPCFALSGFMIGCLMCKGEIWPTRAYAEEIRKLNKRREVADDRRTTGEVSTGLPTTA
jgi:hypothetical protein